MPDCKATCKARLQTILEIDDTSICRSFDERCHPSHLSKPIVYQAIENIKEEVINVQQSARALMTDSLGANGYLNEEIVAKRKSVMPKWERNQQAKKKKMYVSMKERL